MRALGMRFSETFGRRREDQDRELLAEQAAQLRRMVNGFEAQGTGWLWETDRHGRLTYLTDKIAGQVDQGDEPVLGRQLTDVFEMSEAALNGERTLKFHLNARASFADYEVQCVSGQSGDCRWSISGRPWFDDMGQFRGFVGSGCDLTDKRRSEAEIARLAMFDSLTGLANRPRLHFALAQALTAQTTAYRPTGLLMLDLDRFKIVNDTMGHPAGDALLRQVAERLVHVVGDAGLVGRLGGDEFQILLPGESGADRLAELAQAVIRALSQPYIVAGARVVIGCSIGIAVAPDHGEDPETLIRNADLALYSAKAAGRGVHRFYRAELLDQARVRKSLEDDLRAALSHDQFRLVYQPVVSTIGTKVVGYEALIRWNHRSRGPVSPADFIPVAEESRLIEPIGEWVMRTACAAATAWPASVRVAVNVSPVQFAKPSFPDLVARILAETGLAPERLELEITEGVFLNSGQSTDETFAKLKALGVRLALDDFGTGYSSLGYLRTAPFDKIKIDQSFVRGAMDPESRNAAIIKAIVTLADTLGMETTAEGVEAQDEIELITALGCSHIQGFVYSKPIPLADVAAQLGNDRMIQPVGVRFTRAPRTTVLRSALVRAASRVGNCRIRNRSDRGALVDSITGLDLAADDRIELEMSGTFLPAVVRWVKDGRAGLELDPLDVS